MGFNVRRYGEKLLIKPSKAAIKRHRERLAAEMKALRGANAAAVLQRLNPIIRGWSAYYRTVVSTQTYSGLDHYVWQLTYKWATHSHQNKPKRWVVAHYFGEFHKSRRDRWVFGDRESGAYLLKHAWTNIVRHQMVPGRSSPDDPTLVDYWTRRRKRSRPPLDGFTLGQLRAQHGRCLVCGQLLLQADQEPQTPHEWEQWLAVTRKAVRKQAVTAEQVSGQSGDAVAVHLIHAWCRSSASRR